MNQNIVERITTLRKTSMLLIAMVGLGAMLTILLLAVYEFQIVPFMAPFQHSGLLNGFISLYCISYDGDMGGAAWRIDRAVADIGKAGEKNLEQDIAHLRQMEQEAQDLLLKSLKKLMSYHLIFVAVEIFLIQSAYSASVFLVYIVLYYFYRWVQRWFHKKLEAILPMDAG